MDLFKHSAGDDSDEEAESSNESLNEWFIDPQTCCVGWNLVYQIGAASLKILRLLFDASLCNTHDSLNPTWVHIHDLKVVYDVLTITHTIWMRSLFDVDYPDMTILRLKDLPLHISWLSCS